MVKKRTLYFIKNEIIKALRESGRAMTVQEICNAKNLTFGSAQKQLTWLGAMGVVELREIENNGRWKVFWCLLKKRW
jgi:predicted transcriptional regulator